MIETWLVMSLMCLLLVNMQFYLETVVFEVITPLKYKQLIDVCPSFGKSLYSKLECIDATAHLDVISNP